MERFVNFLVDLDERLTEQEVLETVEHNLEKLEERLSVISFFYGNKWEKLKNELKEDVSQNIIEETFSRHNTFSKKQEKFLGELNVEITLHKEYMILTIVHRMNTWEKILYSVKIQTNRIDEVIMNKSTTVLLNGYKMLNTPYLEVFNAVIEVLFDYFN